MENDIEMILIVVGGGKVYYFDGVVGEIECYGLEGGLMGLVGDDIE